MLTVDFRRLGLRPGDRVLDLGAGAGRHAYEAMRLGADVVAYDLDAAGLKDTVVVMDALEVDGHGTAVNGDALHLPFTDASFDRVIAAEVLEHIPADTAAIAELARVLRPGGTIAVSVPRWAPELANWALSDEYHSVPGGHIRIYRASVLSSRSAGGRLLGHRARVRARTPQPVLVAALPGRRRRRPAPVGARLPPFPVLGHRTAPARHPRRRTRC